MILLHQGRPLCARNKRLRARKSYIPVCMLPSPTAYETRLPVPASSLSSCADKESRPESLDVSGASARQEPDHVDTLLIDAVEALSSAALPTPAAGAAPTDPFHDDWPLWHRAATWG